MQTSMLKKRLAAVAISLGAVGMLALPMAVGAQADYGLGESGFQELQIGQDRDLKTTIAQVINIILGFLGIIAVIIILAGGFKWMTAGGNDDKVGEARKMIIQGVIGLVVIFAAWAIASFVITSLVSATGAEGTGTTTTTTP